MTCPHYHRSARPGHGFCVQARRLVADSVCSGVCHNGQHFAAAFPQRQSGLGDMVAAVAQPIARAIDAVAGTDLQNCSGCKKRKAALNRLA